MKLEVVINGVNSREISDKNGQVTIDENVVEYELIKLSSTSFQLNYQDRSYQIHLIEKKNNHYVVDINGNFIMVDVKDHIAQILEELGMDQVLSETINEIVAPMPGAILEVAVNEGDEIKTGDRLLILEAMKMENVIKSPIDATIGKVHVEKGQNVEKNQPLISFS